MMANNEERAASAARPIRPPLRPVWQPTPNHPVSQDETEGKFCGHFCSLPRAPKAAANQGPPAIWALPSPIGGVGALCWVLHLDFRSVFSGSSPGGPESFLLTAPTLLVACCPIAWRVWTWEL